MSMKPFPPLIAGASSCGEIGLEFLSKAQYITGYITCNCAAHWKPTWSNGACNSRSIRCVPLQQKALSAHSWIWLELDRHWAARGCKRSRVCTTVCCNRTRMNGGAIINLQRRRTVHILTWADFHPPHTQQVSNEKITLFKWVRNLSANPG